MNNMYTSQFTVPPAVALLNYILYKLWYTLADFFPNWNFRGFFLHFINFAVRISEAAMKGAGEIIFHNVGAQWKGTPSYCDFSLVFFYIIRHKDQRSCNGPGGGQGTSYDKYKAQ
jgi:hypothetical protein